MDLLELLAKVPPAVSASLVGATIALSGVVVQSMFESRRQRQALRSQERLEQTRRLAALKREIYLPLADAAVRILEYFGSLLRLDSTREQVEARLQDASASIQRAWIAASMRTCRSLKPVSDFFGQAALGLASDRLSLEKLQLGLDRIEEKLHQMEGYQHQLGLALGNLTSPDGGQEDQGEYGWVVNETSRAQEEIQRLQIERQTVLEKRNMEFAVFAGTVLQKVNDLGEYMTELNIAIRNEMGIETDADELREMQADSRQRFKDNIAMMVGPRDPDEPIAELQDSR